MMRAKNQVEEKRHYIRNLCKFVEAIPPSSKDVIDKFAGKCFLASDDGATVTSAQLISIVDNWPGGCQTGRDDFLCRVGVNRPIISLTVDHIDLYYSEDGNHHWYPCVTVPHGLQACMVGAVPKEYEAKCANPGYTAYKKNVARWAGPIEFDALNLRTLMSDQLGEFNIRDEAGCHVSFPIPSITHAGRKLHIRFPL